MNNLAEIRHINGRIHRTVTKIIVKDFTAFDFIGSQYAVWLKSVTFSCIEMTTINIYRSKCTEITTQNNHNMKMMMIIVVTINNIVLVVVEQYLSLPLGVP